MGNLHKLLIIFIKRSVVNSRTCQKTVNRQNVGLNLIHEYWRRDTKLSKHAHCTMPVLCQYEFYNDVNWLSAAMRQLPDIDSSAARFSFLWVITCSGHTAIYTCIESHVAWRVAYISEVHRTHVSIVNARRDRLVPGWWPSLGGYNISVCNKPTRSTQLN